MAWKIDPSDLEQARTSLVLSKIIIETFQEAGQERHAKDLLIRVHRVRQAQSSRCPDIASNTRLTQKALTDQRIRNHLLQTAADQQVAHPFDQATNRLRRMIGQMAGQRRS